MLRDILTHTQAQLQSWLRQKNFEAKKLQPGARTTLLMETTGPYQNVNPGIAPRSFNKAAGVNVKDIKFVDRVDQQKFAGRNGQAEIVNFTTYLTAQDANGAYYLNLKDKVAQIRKLQKLLDDIADELMSGYQGIQQVLPNGKHQHLAIGVAPGADQSARRARLGFGE